MFRISAYVPQAVKSIRFQIKRKFQTPRNDIDENDLTYPDYKAALNLCGAGYEDSELVRLVALSSRNLREQSLSPRPSFPAIELRALTGIGFAIAQRRRSPNKRFNVIDFGGSFGIHYFAAKAVYKGVQFSWNILETAPTVLLGNKEFANGELNFQSGISSTMTGLSDVDLAFSSGALQYHPNPLDALQQLVDIGANNLVVFRTALSNTSRHIVWVQKALLSKHLHIALPNGVNDRETRYPVTFVPRLKFEKIIQSRYQINAIMDEGTMYRIGRNEIPGFGYLCTLVPSRAHTRPRKRQVIK
jgi:putative methyltransferase (TIGR04325 family)